MHWGERICLKGDAKSVHQHLSLLEPGAQNSRNIRERRAFRKPTFPWQSDVCPLYGLEGIYCKIRLSPTAQGHCAFGRAKIALSMSLEKENIKVMVTNRLRHHSICVKVQKGHSSF